MKLTVALMSAGLVLMTMNSCVGLDARLSAAATTQGQTKAAVIVPDQDADCRKLEPHAALAQGQPVVSILKRERSALDRANSRVSRCAADRDILKSTLERTR